MELCSIEDAFPNINTGSVTKGEREKGSGFPFVGGVDDKPSREERRAARKKAKKCKGPAEKYVDMIANDIPDPDRPAAIRLGPIEPFQKQNTTEGPPPIIAKPEPTFSDEGYPSYFGKSDDDLEESFSPFTNVIGDDSTYRLQPDFTKTFDFKGAQKAAGGALPVPNLDESWKPMTEAASYTAFTPSTSSPLTNLSKGSALWSISATEDKVVVPGDLQYLPPTQVQLPSLAPPSPSQPILPAGGNKQEDKDALLARIDTLVGRLENLEKKKLQDTQNEVLIFVGTGLFMLLAFEIIVRK
jgi:hypothetical protein